MNFTRDQREAITRTGRSLLVSAAAGSGKTAVLAERCAGLICGEHGRPPCQAAEILVVTFTDAAAAQMRSRIAEALRARLEGRPRHRGHIEEQLALLPAAPISTIHSFCLDLIRRWFTAAQIDPQAEVLAAEEALLRRHEQIEALFEELYGSEDERARMFRELVEEDFGGSDTRLSEVVLDVYEFARSLPRPEEWLASAAERFAGPEVEVRREIHEVRRSRLLRELQAQADWLADAMTGWSPREIDDCVQLRLLSAYQASLRTWIQQAQRAARERDLDELCAHIAGFEMDARGAGRRKVPSDVRLEAAKNLYETVRKQLRNNRLVDGCARFTGEQYRKDLQAVQPRQRAIIDLAREFGRRYEQAKRAAGLLDFADLEQIAFRVLSAAGDPDRPSDVARRCHQQYQYVLVDEFQDTSPIQEAILRLVSRETAEDAEDNLFAVGDVKQCIYAFRLAEPRLFLGRAERFRDGRAGQLIHLRENFRSRSSVIEAVNAVFERCMIRAFAEIEYDETARLRPGLDYPADDREGLGGPVELHLLEIPSSRHAGEGGEGEEAEDGKGDKAEDNVLEWKYCQREAYLIGRRILDLMGRTGGVRRHVCVPAPDGRWERRPLEYRDIVVLMRAVSGRAEHVAAVFGRMDVPVHADARGGFFETSEVRDMLALLELLDNAQQDIPLAAVLRSPLAGPVRFTESDLVAFRLHAPRAAFHEAVVRYAETGGDPERRERTRAFLARLARLRDAVRRRPLADVIWEIYEETGYLAFVGGMPHGRQRRANLIGLHDRARQFGTFRQQGLRRFLRFIQELRDQKEELGLPSAASEADDVVRILTVHQAKGLEFPVVFVSGLGTRFNLKDAREQVILHRQEGLGMKVVDPLRGAAYPSLAHQLCRDAVLRDTLAEELRILYVAMTRAREHLVLVGSTKDGAIRAAIDPPDTGKQGPVLPLTLAMGRCHLDWVLAALARMPPERRARGDPRTFEAPRGTTFAVFHHDIAAMQEWRVPNEAAPSRRARLAGIAAMEPLPEDEPVAAEDDQFRGVIARLGFEYAPRSMTTVPARLVATDVRPALDPFREDDERPEPIWFGGPPVPPRPGDAGEAAERGVLTHRFLERIDLGDVGDEAALRRQLIGMIESGGLPRDSERLVDLPALAAFFRSELGRRLRAEAARVRREAMFVTRGGPEIWDPALSSCDRRDVILIRGMIDALLPTDEGFEIIDYKTGSATPEQVRERLAHYRSQVETYARAVEAIWRRPVKRRWLVFLDLGQIVSV